MATAALSATEARAGAGIDRQFFAPAIVATAILVALVLLDDQPASAALIVGGFGLGIAFLKAEFSYTASWRRFLTRGEVGGLIGGPIVFAVAATVIVPTAVALIVAVARKRGANYRPSRSYVLGGTTIGLLCIFVLIAGGHPWSVTFRYTVWGAKISSALGFDFSHAAFWQGRAPSTRSAIRCSPTPRD